MKKLFGFLYAFAGVLLAIFFIFIILDIFTRNVLHIPVRGLNEGSVFAFMWMTFIAGAVAFYEDLHYKISIFPEKFEKKIEKFLQIIELLSAVAFSAVLLWQGIVFYKINEMSFSPSLGLKMSNIVSILPLSALVILIFILTRAKKVFFPNSKNSKNRGNIK